jgi:hypothetical protein
MRALVNVLAQALHALVNVLALSLLHSFQIPQKIGIHTEIPSHGNHGLVPQFRILVWTLTRTKSGSRRPRAEWK